MEHSILRLKIHALFGFMMQTFWSFCSCHCLNVVSAILFDTGMFECSTVCARANEAEMRAKNSIAEQWFYLSVAKISHFVLFEWLLRGMKFHSCSRSLLSSVAFSRASHTLFGHILNCVLNANEIDYAYGFIIQLSFEKKKHSELHTLS